MKSRAKTLLAEKYFREAIWRRDRGIDRATGQRLERVSENWDLAGEVCHLKSRGAYPELKYKLFNACLLSARNHRLSDARGGGLLKIEGEDANGLLTFRMTDKTGHVLWTRRSAPP